MPNRSLQVTCVCVHHINQSGPNLVIIYLEKRNAVVDPVRGLPDKRETEKQKEPTRGTICKHECENNSPRKRNQNYPVQCEKTKQNRNINKKASETIIGTTDENAKPGGRWKRCTRYGARRAVERQFL